MKTGHKLGVSVGPHMLEFSDLTPSLEPPFPHLAPMEAQMDLPWDFRILF